jgi:hypothetical protein
MARVTIDRTTGALVIDGRQAFPIVLSNPPPLGKRAPTGNARLARSSMSSPSDEAAAPAALRWPACRVGATGRRSGAGTCSSSTSRSRCPRRSSPNQALRSVAVADSGFRDWFAPYDARVYRFRQ